MSDVQTDIMALVDRVGQTRESLRVADEARRVARNALSAAETVVQDASRDYQMAQNDLVVAAGGTDRSFTFGFVSIREPSVETAA